MKTDCFVFYALTRVLVRNLGLFVLDNFFNSQTCTQIISEMQIGPTEKALIVRSGSEDELLDEDRRKVLTVRPSESTKELVGNQLGGLKSRLEEHFGFRLSENETPIFLRYGEGAFYKMHRDANEDTHVAARRVSVVVFLNACSKQPAPNCYGGGCLTFYGLLPGPQWENCAFSLDAEPGMLLAFKSNVAHEVQPVTSGQRFTIVSWFLILNNSRSTFPLSRKELPSVISKSMFWGDRRSKRKSLQILLSR